MTQTTIDLPKHVVGGAFIRAMQMMASEQAMEKTREAVRELYEDLADDDDCDGEVFAEETLTFEVNINLDPASVRVLYEGIHEVRGQKTNAFSELEALLAALNN